MEEKTLTYQKRQTLKKEVGKTAFFCLAFGSMIGVGWVTAMGSWLNDAGPLGASFAFLIGGAMIFLIGLCYAEVMAMLPLTGGEVAYAYKAFGVQKSFIVGWFLAFGYLSVSAFEAISVGKVISYLIPEIDFWPVYQIGEEVVFASHILLAFFFTLLITWFNYRGIQAATRFQVWLTIGILIAVIFLIIVSVNRGSIENIQPFFGTQNNSWKGFLAVLVTVPFWFVGFDTIPQSAEEANTSVSPKLLGRLILISIAAASLFYVFLILSTSAVSPRENIIDAPLPTAAAYQNVFTSGWATNIVLVTALIGLLTSWNGFFLACSRILFALGRGNIIHSSFGETHSKYGTPAKAVLFCGFITFISVFAGRQAMTAFVDVGSFCMTIAFLGVSISLLKLRNKFPNIHRPYRLKYGYTIARLSGLITFSILTLMLIPGSPVALIWPMEWIILIAVVSAGIFFWYFGKPTRDNITKEERDRQILEGFT
ncbi:APC family permease [Flexithrix dorotheae]|uniref:APC family permease n=1 Tax=Flexithrix dorotheae TaxID=70993 RepID=UPI00035E79D7|nr:APC family permease [Flexithrix dorotheae]